MKKMIALAALFLCGSQLMAQNTYYWVGGATGSWSGSANWNTTLGGGGTNRTTPNVGDILIFDGSNIGAGATGTVSVNSVAGETIAALRFQNNANVNFTSAVAGSAISANMSRTAPTVYGPTGNVTTIYSNVVNMTSTAGIVPGAIITAVGATSIPPAINVVTNVTANSITVTQPATATTNGTATLTISNPINFSTTPSVPIAVGDFLYTGTNSNLDQVTSIVDGTNVFTTTTTAAITSAAGFKVTPLILTSTTNAFSISNNSTVTLSSGAPFVIKLAAGAKGTVDGNLITASGNTTVRMIVEPDGVASLTFKNGSLLTNNSVPSFFGAVANSTNNNVIFEAGSQVIYGASVGTNGIFGAMYPASVVKFNKGSWFTWNGTATGFTSGTNRELPNVKINVNITSFGPPVVDTLLIPSGVSITTGSGAYTAFKGDFINEGNFTFSSGTAGLNFVFTGTVPQRLLLTGTSGAGTITYTTPGGTNNTGGCFQRIVVGPGSTLNLQNGSATLNAYGVTTIWGTLNFGTNVINNISTATASALTLRPSNSATGSTTTLFAATNSYTIIATSVTNFNQGMLISGPGIPPNTYIANVATGNIINVTNPVNVAQGATITSSADPNGASVITANANGIAGSYVLAGTSSYSLGSSPGANYRFNTATTAPFPSTVSSINVNNLTFGADVTNNVTNVTLNGTLNLNSNMLTLRSTDTLRIASGNAVQGYSSNKYVALGVNSTTGTQGVLRMSGLTTSATVFPVGTSTNYLPVTVTPAATAGDYSVAVFTGVTKDATPNGASITALQKPEVVDAVWNVTNNNTPTTNATIQLAWPASLEGANFAGFANNQIGIAPYILNAGWGFFAGTGDNTANTATASVSSFGSFSVGKVGQTLPVKFGTVSVAQTANKQVKISWDVITEINMNKYVVEASKDGVSFTEAGAVTAIGASSYSFLHSSPVDGMNYYRIKAVEKSGSFAYSKTVSINLNKSTNTVMSIYPNPVQNHNLAVSISQPSANLFIQVLAVDGRVLYQTNVMHAGGVVKYNLPMPTQLQKGTYLVKLANNNGVLATQQIILE